MRLSSEIGFRNHGDRLLDRWIVTIFFLSKTLYQLVEKLEEDYNSNMSIFQHPMIKQKEKILISACLTGVFCRSVGGRCKDKRLLDAVEGFELIPVCPEQLGGLSTPREPAEIIGGHNILSGQRAIIQTRTEHDVTSAFINGAQKTLEIARREGVNRAILKSKSPS